ncbi:Hypothetical predicted protein [Marmota monax]|uniref:Uncharacterized protein n=1 Tax=Marmota monax TaxID=9995 RepID=A0A5E4BV52_MARMO|nr:Hypothetical predicted protein [Marmota monax]
MKRLRPRGPHEGGPSGQHLCVPVSGTRCAGCTLWAFGSESSPAEGTGLGHEVKVTALLPATPRAGRAEAGQRLSGSSRAGQDVGPGRGLGHGCEVTLAGGGPAEEGPGAGNQKAHSTLSRGAGRPGTPAAGLWICPQEEQEPRESRNPGPPGAHPSSRSSALRFRNPEASGLQKRGPGELQNPGPQLQARLQVQELWLQALRPRPSAGRRKHPLVSPEEGPWPVPSRALETVCLRQCRPARLQPAPDGVVTRLQRHVVQQQCPGALLPPNKHHARGAAPGGLSLVRGLLLRRGPGLQPAGAERAGRRAAGQLLPAVPLPHPAGRPGPHRLPGASGHRGPRGVPARRALRLAHSGPRLRPLPLHGRGHGLLRPVSPAAGGRHGLRALPGHHPALLPLGGRLAAPRLGHRGAGVGGGAGAGAAAPAGRGPLHRAVPRLLVLPHAGGAARGRGLRAAVRAARRPVGRAVLPAQHHQRGHPVPRLPRAGGRPAAPARLRGGDDGAAPGHHAGGQRLLDAAAGLHRPDGAAEPACHEPGRAAVPGHGAAAAHLPARGHLEPDPGPLGVHPVPPRSAAPPAPAPQRQAQVPLPAAAAGPGRQAAVGPARTSLP